MKQKEKIRLMEEQHKKEIYLQKSELERLQVEKDMGAARARLEVYDREIRQETDSQSIQLQSMCPRQLSVGLSEM